MMKMNLKGLILDGNWNEKDKKLKKKILFDIKTLNFEISEVLRNRSYTNKNNK